MFNLTSRQKELLKKLIADGFIEKKSGFGNSQQNRPMWALVELGLAEFDFGPKNSAVQVQGFIPTPLAFSTSKAK